MGQSLAELLVPEAISLNLAAREARQVVTHLGQILFQRGYVKETFVEAALEREKKMPTGLPLAGELNAAIPHTDIEHVLKPAVALATLAEPVVFHNMIAPEEDVSVRVVFLLALEQPKSQVEMLQEVASVLQRADILDRLVQAQDVETVRAILQDGGSKGN